jgi:hypothetical protein
VIQHTHFPPTTPCTPHKYQYLNPFESLSSAILHLYSEQVSETNLGDVVGDVLVVQQVGVIDIGRAWLVCGVGLDGRAALERGWKGSGVRILTILTPSKEGWTDPASFQTLGPVVPIPQLDTTISYVIGSVRNRMGHLSALGKGFQPIRAQHIVRTVGGNRF